MTNTISGWNPTVHNRVGMLFCCSAFLLYYVVQGSSQRWRQSCTQSIQFGSKYITKTYGPNGHEFDSPTVKRIFFKGVGSPLFCKNSNGEYGLAGIAFGMAEKVALFAITGKWRSNFISKIIKGETGNYRTLWKNPSINHRKESGSPRMNTSCIIWFYLFFTIWIFLKLIN